MRYKVFEKPTHRKSVRIHFKCENCAIDVWEKPNSYARYKNHFCSRSCRHKFMEKYNTEKERKRARYLQTKRWQSKNINTVRKWKKASNIRCRERVAHGKAKYKSRRRGAIGTHTLKEWQKLKEKVNHKCVMCGEKKRLTKDHVLPLILGGTDNIDNIQPLCARCNSIKGTECFYLLLQ